MGRRSPYQCLVVDLLSDELVLTKRVACLSGDGVNGAFLHLLLDGTEEGEEGFARALLQYILERGDQNKTLRPFLSSTQCQQSLIMYG